MFGATGLDIAKYVKEKTPSTYVILITGHLVFEYAKTAIDNKVDFFLTKPFSSKDFIEILNKIETEINLKIEQTQTETTVYLKEWKYLASNIEQVFNGKAPLSIIENEKCCVTSKSFRNLKTNLIYFSISDSSEADFSLKDTVDFDSYNLSVFYLSENHKFHFALSFFSRTEAFESYISDLENNINSPCRNLKIQKIEIKNLAEIQNLQTVIDLAFKYFYNITHAITDDSVITSILALNTFRIEIFFKIVLKLFKDMNIIININDFKNYSLKEILEVKIPRFLPEDAICFSIIDAATKYIEKNYSDYLLSLSKVAEALHVSSDYLGKLFKIHLNTNYTDFISTYRFDKAKELLKTSDLSIAQISNAVGYRDIQYFRKSFKKKIGVSPIAYKKYELIGKIYED